MLNEEQVHRQEQDAIDREYAELAKLMSQPAPTGPDYLIIATRSRNLAVTWTNQAVQRYSATGDGYLAVREPSEPTEWGGIKGCEAELAYARRINSGGVDWRSALWVGKRRVIGHLIGQALFTRGTGATLAELREYGSITVKLAPVEVAE